jgi:predicted metalloprotease with PDZ domain
MANDINQVENTPGKKFQSIADASYDAWIKAYRPTENSNNSTISYYSKGSVAAMMLDLEIIHDSQTKYSLDDVMRYMYNEYYKTLKRGYTDAEFKKGLEKFAGKNLDDFYKKYVYGVADVDYNKYLSYAGYQLTDEAAGSNEPSLGIMTASSGGKIFVTNVLRDGTAWVDGINVNDEIVSVDGTPVTDVTSILANKNVGDKLSITISRDGLSLVFPVTLLKNSLVKYKIETVANPSAQQLKVRNKWLKL